MKRKRIFLPLLLLFVLVGCSAMAVPSSSASTADTAASAAAESTAATESTALVAGSSGVTAPRIIESFLDIQNCEGKTVYLFCTSGSSGAERSLKDLQKLYPKVDFAAANRFGAKASEADVSNWLNGLNG